MSDWGTFAARREVVKFGLAVKDGAVEGSATLIAEEVGVLKGTDLPLEAFGASCVLGDWCRLCRDEY